MQLLNQLDRSCLLDMADTPEHSMHQLHSKTLHLGMSQVCCCLKDSNCLLDMVWELHFLLDNSCLLCKWLMKNCLLDSIYLLDTILERMFQLHKSSQLDMRWLQCFLLHNMNLQDTTDMHSKQLHLFLLNRFLLDMQLELLIVARSSNPQDTMWEQKHLCHRRIHLDMSLHSMCLLDTNCLLDTLLVLNYLRHTHNLMDMESLRCCLTNNSCLQDMMCMWMEMLHPLRWKMFQLDKQLL